MPSILHIDDDRELGELLSQYLKGEGFQADYTDSPAQGLDLLNRTRYDLLILDVMMPDQSGLDTLKALRNTHTLPVLMLTARGDDIDRIIGLELGADDYVPKPCMPREIVARIRAILRRTSTQAQIGSKITLGKVTMDSAKRRVCVNNKEAELTSAEFNILEVLLRNARQVVSKHTLSEQGLGRPLARYDRAIDVHLSNIRQKLGLQADKTSDPVNQAGAGLVLHTIRGQGYQLSEA